MTDELKSFERRLAFLEELVVLLFASEHMLSSDPAQAARRLEEFLEVPAEPGDPDPERKAFARAIISRIEQVQRELPKKLVD